MAWLIRWIYHPKFRALVIRQHADDLKDWIDRARSMYATCGGIVVGNPAEIRFPSGAKIRIGHLRDANAYTKYQGHEYHKMIIEELTQIPREENYLKLISSCRSVIPELRPQVFCTTNPGGLGNSWVKKRFVVNEPYKVFTDEITRRTRIFIPATIEDNPTLMQNDPAYVTFLEGLPENLKKAWRYGDFNVFIGQFFSEFSEKIHTAAPFAIPDSWARIRSIDHGRTAPTACLWGAIDCDGAIWWYREYYQANVDADVNAQNIARLSGDEKYKFTLLDSACFSKTGYGETIADIYNKNGVYVIPSPKNRLAGWSLFHEYLRVNELTKLPRMFFFQKLL